MKKVIKYEQVKEALEVFKYVPLQIRHQKVFSKSDEEVREAYNTLVNYIEQEKKNFDAVVKVCEMHEETIKELKSGILSFRGMHPDLDRWIKKL